MVDHPMNWVLLAELVTVVVGASAFLFYWNRLVASIFAFILRLITWRLYSAYISIGALQVSPLAGRISFRDLEYHSSNISVRALNGHITWRYWKLRVRHEEDTESTNLKRNRLPCRITVFAQGVESFVYNRTPAYDAIVERMMKHEHQDEDSQKSSAGSNGTSAHQGHAGARFRKAAKSAGTETSSEHRRSDSSDDHPIKPFAPGNDLPYQPKPVKMSTTDGVNWFREALPIEIKVISGSVVLGSDATPMVLVGDFMRVEGVLSISDSKSICDRYKLSMEMKFDDPKVLMRTNVDYSGPILSHGKKAYDELLKRQPDVADQPPSTISVFSGFHFLARTLSFLFDPKFSSPPVVGLPRDRIWKGLARYRMVDADVPVAPRREEREYGKVTTLLESPVLECTYYADTPGPAPWPSDAELVDETDELGNVEPPPEYGVDIVIHGGFIKYGPWADRQRDALQRAFAPAIFFDSEPKPRLRPGDTRIHTALTLNIQLSGETTLRIPTREPSKDWLYDNSSADVERRYGWLDVTVGPDSSIFFTQAQFATQHGYDAMLVLHLDSLQIGSSVNLESFVRSKACRLSMTMPTPLRWDAQRDWGLDLTLDNPDIALLRDHVQLISEVARDWSSGAVGDFHHFVPNHYNFRISLINYVFHFYLNDFNIVDRPRSREDNAIMDIVGSQVDAYVAVSATQYRPELAVVPFSVHLSDARVELCIPRWDTHRAFGQGDTIEVGKIGDLTASGSYRYYSVPRPDHQENLALHLEVSVEFEPTLTDQGRRVVFKALGWALRRMFCLKDNYFGGFTQFTTMQEYLERFDHNPDSVGDPVEEKYRPGRSDPYAVNLTMNVEDSLVLLSDEIYSCERGLAMPVPQLQMALKSIEQFMEMSLDTMPTYVVASDNLAETYKLETAPLSDSKNAIFLEGIELKANRLFGPQPRATTYLCLWEFTVPRVSAFLSPQLASTLKASIAAVLYNFDDVDNAPASIYIPKSPPDVTFFKLGIDHLSAVLFAGESAVSVDFSSGINLDTSTLGTRSCSSMIGLSVPILDVHLLQRDFHSRKWRSAGSMTTNLSVDLYNAPKGWQEKASLQQDFIREQDAPTHRIWYMYRDSHETPDGHHENGVYLPNPRAVTPEPFDEEASSVAERSSVLKARPSSPDSIDADRSLDAGRQAQMRRQSRSFATAQEDPEESSIGDESDSTSTAGSSSATSAFARSIFDNDDMPGALADRLRLFRSFSEDHPSLGYKNTNNDEPFPTNEKNRRALNEGTVIRLTSSMVEARCSPNSLASAAGLLKALRTKSEMPERVIDALLVRHTDVVQEDAQQSGALMLDVCVAQIAIHLTTPAISGDPLSALNFRARGMTCSVQKTPASGDTSAGFDLALFARAISLVATPLSVGRPDISLKDVGNPNSNELSDTAVASANVDGIRLGFLNSDQRSQLQGTVGLIDVQVVTTAVGLFLSMAQIWTQAIDSAHEAVQTDSSSASLLYRILKGTIATSTTSDQPSFVYESAYSLHVEDQRNIRRDPGWMMLARLRHWLRQGVPVIITDDVPMPDVAEFVVSQLAKLDDAAGGNADLVRQQEFVKSAFGNEIEQPVVEGTSPANRSRGLFVTVDSLMMRHFGRLFESGEIAPSTLRVLSASIGLRRSANIRDDRPLQQLRVVTTVRSVEVEIQSGAFSAVQSTLKSLEKHTSSPPSSKSIQPSQDELASVVVIDGHLLSASLSVLASGVRLRFGVSGTHASLSHRETRKINGDDRLVSARSGVTVCSELIELALLQPLDEHDLITHSVDRVVISTKADGFRMVADSNGSTRRSASPHVRLLVGLNSLEFDSRPQLRAFYLFARDWRERHYRHYQPMVDEIQTIFANSPTKPPSAPSVATNAKLGVNAKLDVSIGSVHLHVRAAKAVWLRWDVGKVYFSRQASQEDVRFGIRVALQLVGAYTSNRRSKIRDASTIRLPSLNAIGSHRSIKGRPHLSATISLGCFIGILKPAVLDRLLSLHQSLRTDVMDFVQEYRYSIRKALKARRKKDPPTSSVRSVSAGATGFSKILFDLRLDVAGVRFGLKADDVASTLLFEAFALKGHATNQTTQDAAVLWRAKVQHFGLSLGHLGTADLPNEVEPSRKHRSAYMVVDVDVKEIPGAAGATSQLNVYLSRVHTVMHIAALSELSDLVRSWQSDVHSLRDHRATEVAEVREQTTRIFQNLETNEKTTTPEASWFANRLFTIDLTGLGIAIPLDEAAAIDLQQRESSTTPALLFSIRVISFHNRRNETARFKVQQTVLQFIDKFDQGVHEHFNGDFHPSSNRMSLPSVESEAQMSSTPGLWSLSAHSSATDFKLSLAPDVAAEIYKLIDLYERGKDRISELEHRYRIEVAKLEAQDSVAAKYEDTQSPVFSRTAQTIMIRMSFTFNSGIVELNQTLTEEDRRMPPMDLRGGPNRSVGHDIFTLPTISVWTDYAGPKTAIAESNDDSGNHAVLLFNAAVHESRNTLRPSIIPFFVDALNRIEDRVKASRPSVAPTGHSGPTALSSISESPLQIIANPRTGKCRLQLTLRIDRSELRLSCAPDSSAYVDLKWESGGFFASTTADEEQVTTMAGTVSGVTASLSHEFADQGRSCVEASAKDMAFSFTLCPGTINGNQKGLSIVLDTQLSAHFRLEAFSAWLIFIAVWVDSAPKLHIPLRASVPDAATTPSAPMSAAPRKLSVVALVRLRSVDFDANIAVSTARLEITPITLRTVSNGERTEVDLRSGVTQISARGDISGDVRSESLVFNTSRRSSRASSSTEATVLELSIDGGDLSGNLFLAETNIMRFHLAPSHVVLADDWKAYTLDPAAQVSLAFAVKAGQFEGVLRLLAIPRLLGNFYSFFDMVNSQHKIAAQRSESFKMTEARKSTQSSPVAAAMTQTSRMATSVTSSSHIETAQTMRFDLSGIDLGVFNEDLEDGHVVDFYRFVAGKVEADFKRELSREDLPTRELNLLVSYIRWDTMDGARAAAQEKRSMSARQLIDLAGRYGRREVASLPLMTLKMPSIEYPDPATLDYDFDLLWGETDGDVAILPNFFEQAYHAFQKLLKGLDEQQLARARRRGIIEISRGVKRQHGKDASEEHPPPDLHTALAYRRRQTVQPGSMPIPRLKLLGEGTTDAAKLVPKIKSAVNELPSMSHRFVTLPLEEGMDLLLKLYEKQLPTRTA